MIMVGGKLREGKLQLNEDDTAIYPGICFIKMFALKELSSFCLLALCYLNITLLITRYAVDPTRGI